MIIKKHRNYKITKWLKMLVREIINYKGCQAMYYLHSVIYIPYYVKIWNLIYGYHTNFITSLTF